VLQPRAVDLNAVAGGLLSFLDKVIGKEIEFKFLSAKLDAVKADAAQIAQVIRRTQARLRALAERRATYRSPTAQQCWGVSCVRHWINGMRKALPVYRKRRAHTEAGRRSGMDRRRD
jgi:hypothetical protein